MKFDVGVLGPLSVCSNGAPIEIGGKPALIVALLVARAGEVVSIDSLIDGLWGDHPPATARKAVQVNVSHARRILGADFPLHTERGGYRISGEDLSIDAVGFVRAVATAASQLESSPNAAIETATQALALWRGVAYADFDDSETLRAESLRLGEQRLRAMRVLFDARLRTGDHASVIGELDAATVEHPYDEDFRRMHMLALYRSGRRTDALRAFDRTREFLIDAGLEPSQRLQSLFDDMLHQEDRIEAPAERSTSATPDGNLPEPRSKPIGRDHEIHRVNEVLGQSRLVTLTGVGGVGKTTLALAAARADRSTFINGCWLVELANVVADEQVHTALVEALGVQVQGRARPLDALCDALAGLRLLIILDNCEHVLGGVVEVADRLLDALPGVTILATSREGLGLRGEHQLAVAPLETTGPNATAVELFGQRARESGWKPTDADLDDPSVAQLCERLDGIPLAIELAAARARSMSIAQLNDRLCDRFRLLKGARRIERHQTLEATMAWSYDLLETDERRLFDRLCVFTGPFELTAAERVLCDENLDELAVGEHLGSLVDKSMLVAESGNFRLLETMRQFAEARCTERDLATTRDRHRDYYTSFIIEAHQGHMGADEATWARRVATAWPNIRVAFGWAIECDAASTALTIVAHLAKPIQHSGHFAEFHDWAALAVELSGSKAEPLYASCLGIAAYGRAMQGDLERARSLAERSRESLAKTEIDFDQHARGGQAVVCAIDGRIDEAIAITSQKVKAGAGDHPALQATNLADLALFQAMDLRPDEARATAERAVARARETTSSAALAFALQIHGLAIETTDPVRALGLFDEALAVCESASQDWVAGATRQRMAHALMDLDHSTDALELGLETGWFMLRRGQLWLANDSVFVCARAFQAMQHHHRAALLFGACLWSDPTGLRGPRRSGLRAQLAEALGEPTATDLIERGKTMSVHQALELAQSDGEVIDDSRAFDGFASRA